MKTYSEKLQSPAWQKKRLEILNRDEFECKGCGDNKTQLHVHHLEYTSNDPAKEDNDNLITLCSKCHKAIHSNNKLDKLKVIDGINESLCITDYISIENGFVELIIEHKSKELIIRRIYDPNYEEKYTQDFVMNKTALSELVKFIRINKCRL